MTTEKLELINDMVDIDFIIDNPESVYNIITGLINEIRRNQMAIQLNKEAMELYWLVMKELKKKNKELHKKLSKYEK